MVEGKPYEGAQFPWTSVVPNSSDSLRGSGVLKIEALYEGDHAGSTRWFPGIIVASFGGVTKERSVPEGQGGLPVPLPWVPWEILDEPGFKDPMEGRFIAWSLQFLGHFEGRPRSLLR